MRGLWFKVKDLIRLLVSSSIELKKIREIFNVFNSLITFDFQPLSRRDNRGNCDVDQTGWTRRTRQQDQREVLPNFLSVHACWEASSFAYNFHLWRKSLEGNEALDANHIWRWIDQRCFRIKSSNWPEKYNFWKYYWRKELDRNSVLFT